MAISKARIKGTLSSFLTLLEKYPVLMADDDFTGRDSSLTAISFLLELLDMFGVSDARIYEWLSKILLDKEDGAATQGVLFAIEESIKAILLGYLNNLYTCPIDPIVPEYFIEPINANVGASKSGISVPLSRIDAFGVLKNSPYNEIGSIFYFDNNLSPSEAWKSTDFNAFLWYTIYRGSGGYEGVWDNRVQYFRFLVKDQEKRKTFLNAHCATGQSNCIVNGVGIKKEIMQCTYEENGSNGEDTLTKVEAIRVRGNAERYEGNTVRQFNVDYLSSLKLFNSKTLVAQVINSMLGIAPSIAGELSMEMSIIEKQVERIVEKTLSEETIEIETEGDSNDYFLFSDKEYSDIVNDATLRYNHEYETGNDEGDLVTVNPYEVAEFVKHIEDAETEEERRIAIIAAISGVTNSISNDPSIGLSDSFSFNKNIIFKFIKNLSVQIAMQVLSPKVMLLFAINQCFLGDGENEIMSPMNWAEFFKDMWNIISKCVVDIADTIIRELLNFVVSLIKPIVSLVVRKLMLESLYYYRETIQNLMQSCTSAALNIGNISFGRFENMDFGNVNYADIIPQQISPDA